MEVSGQRNNLISARPNNSFLRQAEHERERFSSICQEVRRASHGDTMEVEEGKEESEPLRGKTRQRKVIERRNDEETTRLIRG